MAPTKKDATMEKETKLTSDQSAALIMDYLRKTNRPYSATDISTNLKNRVTKTAAAKLLKDLHERNEIEGKAAGKQIVYHVIQEEPEENALEALQAMHTETERLKDAIVALKQQEKDLRVDLREVTTVIPLSAVKASVTALESEKAVLEARLERLRGGDVKPITAEEREKVAQEFKYWSKVAGARRKIRLELWKDISSLDHVTKEVAEELKEKWELPF